LLTLPGSGPWVRLTRSYLRDTRSLPVNTSPVARWILFFIKDTWHVPETRFLRNATAEVLGEFTKLWKRLPASSWPYATTRLPLDWFSLDSIFDVFRKSVEKIQVSLKSDKNNGYFTWRTMYIYGNISLNYS